MLVRYSGLADHPRSRHGSARFKGQGRGADGHPTSCVSSGLWTATPPPSARSRAGSCSIGPQISFCPSLHPSGLSPLLSSLVSLPSRASNNAQIPASSALPKRLHERWLFSASSGTPSCSLLSLLLPPLHSCSPAPFQTIHGLQQSRPQLGNSPRFRLSYLLLQQR